MFKTSISICTDGDAYCKDYNHVIESTEVMFLIDSFSNSMDNLKAYLREIEKTLEGRDRTVEVIKYYLNIISSTLNGGSIFDNQNYNGTINFEKEEEFLSIDLDLGNEDISIEIVKVTEIEINGVKKLIPLYRE